MAVHYDAIHWLNLSSCEDIRFYEIGKQQCERGYSYGPIIRDKYVLHYVLSGEGSLTINQKTFQRRWDYSPSSESLASTAGVSSFFTSARIIKVA